MTVLAFGTQCPLVLIVIFMTADALQVRISESSGQVAFLTGSCGVQSKQRETGQVMVEDDVFIPATRLVATLTLLALLPVMDIIRTMAADAFNR